MKVYAIKWHNKQVRPCYWSEQGKWELLEYGVKLFDSFESANDFLFDNKIKEGYVVELKLSEVEEENIEERVERAVDAQRRVLLPSKMFPYNKEKEYGNVVMTTYSNGTIVIMKGEK